MFLGVGDAVQAVGQSVALVLADTFQHALAASRAIDVTYSAAAAPPIISTTVRLCGVGVDVVTRGHLCGRVLVY